MLLLLTFLLLASHLVPDNVASEVNLNGVTAERISRPPRPTIVQPSPPYISDLVDHTSPLFIKNESSSDIDGVVANSTSVSDTPDSPLGYDKSCGIRGNGTIETDRIVGGSDATRGEFPWAVSIQLSTGPVWRHICGGSIISKSWIVTAGHCVENIPVKSLSIVAGDYNLYKKEGDEQRVSVVRSLGRRFVKRNFTEDIALLQLYPPLKMKSDAVAPICLPSSDKKFTKGTGVVAGWGRLKEEGTLPHILQTATLPIIDKRKCQQLYSSSEFSEFLHSCQICSGFEMGGIDSCQGDSGGGLACRRDGDSFYYLCGIVSWGVGCARPFLPGVYTDVSCYSDWIADIVYNRNEAVSLATDLAKNS